jgi:hypothetical protein
MIWTELDWAALDRLRDRFLSARACEAPYWTSPGELASYDLTFGERIGWKWDAVLDELQMVGWEPPGGTILDWGCGSGVAGRRVLDRYRSGRFQSLVVWDHSPLATDFAHDAARTRFPGLEVSMATTGYLQGSEPIGVLVISHVLNELPAEALEQVRTLARRARAVLWTEPGTRQTSRALGALRDEWSSEFALVAPCTHNHPCPVRAPGNERHWCHFFAAPAPAIFADSNWVKFGQRAGIDLRSLPYSFVAMDRGWKRSGGALSRIIGRPESFKPYVRLLNCDARGLADLTVMKRDNPSLYKELDRTKRPLVYEWVRDGEKIVGGSHPAPDPESFARGSSAPLP